MENGLEVETDVSRSLTASTEGEFRVAVFYTLNRFAPDIFHLRRPLVFVLICQLLQHPFFLAPPFFNLKGTHTHPICSSLICCLTPLFYIEIACGNYYCFSLNHAIELEDGIGFHPRRLVCDYVCARELDISRQSSNLCPALHILFDVTHHRLSSTDKELLLLLGSSEYR